MHKILRITNSHALKSASPADYTGRLDEATHAYFYFAGYVIHDDGVWEEGRSWAGAISVRRLWALMHDAGLLREVTTAEQSGGDDHDQAA